MREYLLYYIIIINHLFLLFDILPKEVIFSRKMIILILGNILILNLIFFIEKQVAMIFFSLLIFFKIIFEKKWNFLIFLLTIVLLGYSKYFVNLTFFIAIDITMLWIALFTIQFVFFSDDINIGQAHYYIVLGARIDENGEPSRALINRLEILFNLIDNRDVPIIVTGGKAHSKYIEAEYMSKYLIGKGISENSILMESNSKNTYENIYNAKIILEKLTLHNKIGIIITSDFHALRSYLIAKRHGLRTNIMTCKVPLNIFLKLSIGEINKCYKYYMSEMKYRKKILVFLLIYLIFECAFN